jgi:hypothetical protein
MDADVDPQCNSNWKIFIRPLDPRLLRGYMEGMADEDPNLDALRWTVGRIMEANRRLRSGENPQNLPPCKAAF